jgi:hypothetical protein
MTRGLDLGPAIPFTGENRPSLPAAFPDAPPNTSHPEGAPTGCIRRARRFHDDGAYMAKRLTLYIMIGLVAGIVVAEQEEADDIIARLRAGEPFDQLARQHFSRR